MKRYANLIRAADSGSGGHGRRGVRAAALSWARGHWELAMGRAGPERCAGERRNGPQEIEKETWAALGRLGKEVWAGLGLGFCWVFFSF